MLVILKNILKCLFSIAMGGVATIIFFLILGTLRLVIEDDSVFNEKAIFNNLNISPSFDPNSSRRIPKSLHLSDDKLVLSIRLDENDDYKSLIITKSNDPNVAFIIAPSKIHENSQIFIYGRDGINKYVDYNFDGKFDMKGVIGKYRQINIDNEWLRAESGNIRDGFIVNKSKYCFDTIKGAWRKK